jgi:hypothetical protein
VPYLEDPAGGALVADATGLRREKEYRADFEELRQISAGPEPGAGGGAGVPAA